MADEEDFQLAVQHYRMLYPDAAALGSGSPPATWKAEYDRVAESGLGATLVTGTGTEGTSVSSARNFDQKLLMRALHFVRSELDSDYTPYSPAAVDPRPARRLGFTVRLGY